jgi:predicted transcriptional regulator
VSVILGKEAFLDVQKWQVDQIYKSLKQADAGNLLTNSEVRKLTQTWRPSQ